MSTILSLIEKHEALRSGGINLVVSENRQSENVKKALACDLAGRYHASWYGGTGVAREIVETTEVLASRLFDAEHALVTPLSGNICDLAALLAFTSPGDSAAMVPFTSGGYPFGVTKFDRKLFPIPVDPETFSIDTQAACDLISREKIALTILGASCIPFPHPVREISRCVRESGHGGVCVFDGSHVLGLIACGEFQDPLGEGADVLIGSTHKTFFGPQGGVMLTRSKERADALNRYLEFDLDEGLGLVDNPHVNRIAALGVAIEEMLDDPGYGGRVIENARTLAAALDDLGVPVRFKERGYTCSHQVVLDLDSESAQRFCEKLEAAGIFIDIGGRIGTAEATRMGMGPDRMKEIAQSMAKIFRNTGAGR